MIQDIAPAVFSNNYKHIEPQPTDTVIVFGGMSKREDRVLLKSGADGWEAPTWQEITAVLGDAAKTHFLFSVDDQDFFLLQQYMSIDDCLQLEGYSYTGVREVRNCQPPVLCFAVMTAYHLYEWYRANRFCGKCGKPTRPFVKERALKCTCCDNLIFPKICPAVIIGVKNGDSILMSQYANRGGNGKSYALIAGFCEIGETPEETVAREVMEEVGLKVKNITYYKSQPWGFECDLLLGYYCDVDGDDAITLDRDELANARFFKREDIPYAGGQGYLTSLTATMIEKFRNGQEPK